MSNGIIVRLIPLAPAQVGGSSQATAGFNAAFPVTNLADRQPKIVMQTNTVAGVNDVMFEIDLGADTALDTVAVMFTNLSVAAGQWQIYGATSAMGFGLAFSEPGSLRILGFTGYASFGVAPTTRENRRHGLATGNSVTVRFLRIYLRDNSASNPEQLIRAGVVLVGQKIGPAFNYELGSGRKVDDQSIMRTLPGGETVGELGGRTPIYRCTWSNLTEAEMRQIWSLQMEIGVGSPVLVIEDPDAVTGQAEAMHYGLFESLDFNERTQLDKQRWEMRVRELV